MTKEKVLIIGGGVGPMAGVALHALIIENTVSGGSDQGHLDVRHFSRSAAITDRTQFLLGREKVNPAIGMARTIGLAAAGLDGHDAVIGVPCNTFHAPAIFGSFAEQVIGIAKSSAVSMSLIHMLDETIGLLKLRVPEAGSIGVMSTTGTRASGVYDTLLTGAGYSALYVDQGEQELLHTAIYDPSWGIKATGRPSSRSTKTLADLAARLVDRGAQAIILGCTELPLALTESSICGIPLVDPVLALARAMIREAAPSKLAPLPYTSGN